MPVVRAGQLDFVPLPGRTSADPLPAGLAVGASARVVRIAPGPRTPHVHPYSAELVYVVSGTGTAWEDDVPSAVGAGDLVVVPPGVPHATVASGTSDLVLVCFFPHPDLRANLQELPGPERTAL
ncbi:cupin domain-containing protein [Blastococcus sp. SYSU D00669]